MALLVGGPTGCYTAGWMGTWMDGLVGSPTWMDGNMDGWAGWFTNMDGWEHGWMVLLTAVREDGCYCSLLIDLLMDG